MRDHLTTANRDHRPVLRRTSVESYIRLRGRAAGRGRNTMVSIERYGRRNWAVYLNGELLVVTVYLKGALAVRNALESAMRLAVVRES